MRKCLKTAGQEFLKYPTQWTKNSTLMQITKKFQTSKESEIQYLGAK